MSRPAFGERFNRFRSENCSADGLGGRKERQFDEFGGRGIRRFHYVDRNLSFQQNLPKFNIAVLVIYAKSNRLADLQPFAPKILEVLSNVKKGEVIFID